MSPSTGTTVGLFTAILSGGNLPIIPFTEQLKPELEPDENICIRWLTSKNNGKKTAMNNLTLFYRSPGNTKEIRSIYFGDYNPKQVKQEIHLKDIREATSRVGIKLPKNLFI